MAKHKVVTPPHLVCQTQFSLTGRPNMKNRKPFRTKEQKELARATARKGDDGVIRSDAQVSYH